jgi:hypothetical protein
MHVDRRRSPRIELLGRVQGRSVTLDAPVTVREISLGGMAIETPAPFEAAAVHAFRLTMGDGSTVELVGRVMHSRPATSGRADRFVTGVQFVDADSPDGSAAAEEIVGQIR